MDLHSSTQIYLLAFVKNRKSGPADQIMIWLVRKNKQTEPVTMEYSPSSKSMIFITNFKVL